MTSNTYKDVARSLWHGHDPYLGFQGKLYRPDPQGWNSSHMFLSHSIFELKPKIVVEVGVWKGASTLFMASKLKSEGLDAVVIAVDTWLGSWDHWQHEQYFADLLTVNGYPHLFYTFMANVFEAELKDYVVPLPLDSGNASQLLSARAIRPDIIHIDGGHDFDAVQSDLGRWWPMLNPGGIMIIDDYDKEGKVWPSVRDAVDQFVAATKPLAFEATPYKCRFRKPL